MMRIFIDISHPAHAHFFRYIILELRKRGHPVFIGTRHKEMTEGLLSSFGFDFVRFSSASSGIASQFGELALHWMKVFRFIKKNRIDIAISISGLFTALPARLARVFSVMETDTEDAALSNRISAPFADIVVTPSAYLMDYGRKHIRYNGYHELAYMHPSWFRPDKTVIKRYGLRDEEPFWVVRTVEWGALHDKSEQGLSRCGLEDAVKILAKTAKVIVSAEDGHIPDGCLTLHHPADMHHLLYFAAGYLGESPTMAMEAAISGTPSFLVSSRARKLGYIVEMEQKYGLIKIFLHEEGLFSALEHAALASCDPKNRIEQRDRANRMLKDKDDVVSWFVNAIENWFEQV